MSVRTKLTPANKEIIFKAVRLGLSYNDAARAANILPQTLRYWRSEGSKPGAKKLYRDFMAEFNAIESEMAFECAQIVRDAATTIREKTKTKIIPAKNGKPAVVERVIEKILPDPKWAAWWLERRRPDEFGPKIDAKIENTGPPSEINIVFRDPEDAVEEKEDTDDRPTEIDDARA